MNTKVLVYDSQDGYFELLKKTFRECSFIHYKNSETNLLQDIQMIIFFINDQLELPDYVKLYRNDIPIIFGLAGKAGFKEKNHAHDGNIHFLNLDMPKNSILKHINKTLNKITGIGKSIKKAG